MAPETSGARRGVDAAALARITRRLALAAEPPWLHGEAARRMAERLAIVKAQPARIADWGAFAGAGGALLAQAYPQAEIVAIEPDAERRRRAAEVPAAPWWSPRRWTQQAPRVLEPEALAPGSVQLLWSNMALHFAADPQALLAAWHRALVVDGFLMFTTLGPGSLAALRALYAAQGWGEPFAPFVDMHDLGDMLVHAGFADPVMDQEMLTLTWASPEALVAELHALGGNAGSARHAGLRTPRWRQRLLQALAARADAQGRIPLQFELVYGHAFKPLHRAKVEGVTAVPLEDLRANLRAGHRPGLRRGGTGLSTPEDPDGVG